jgi:hypothetical protein
MGSEDRPQREVQHRLFDSVGADPQSSKLAHRPARRSRLWVRLRPTQISVPPADAVSLLGGIDQQEKESKCAGRDGALFDVKTVDLVQDSVETRSAAFAVSTGTSGHAQPFDDLKRLFALEPPDDATEGSCEPANVLVERKIFFSRRSRRWHGFKIPLCGTSPPPPRDCPRRKATN